MFYPCPSFLWPQKWSLTISSPNEEFCKAVTIWTFEIPMESYSLLSHHFLDQNQFISDIRRFAGCIVLKLLLAVYWQGCISRFYKNGKTDLPVVLKMCKYFCQETGQRGPSSGNNTNTFFVKWASKVIRVIQL